MTPHISAELWERIGKSSDIEEQTWPTFDPEAAKEDEITLVVQVNGKVRSRLQVAADTVDSALEEMALSDEKVKKFIADKPIRKVIVVKNKLINVVV